MFEEIGALELDKNGMPCRYDSTPYNFAKCQPFQNIFPN